MSKLTEAERNVLSQVDEDGAIAFLQRLVQIDSQNPPGNEYAVAHAILEKMDKLGLDVEIQEVEPGRINVLARLPGESEEELLFNGHMDTVKFGSLDNWTKDPLGGVIEDGKLYGRGSCDMKSGLASMIFGIEALVKSGIPRKKSILFTAVIDEEVFFKGTQALIDANKLSKCTRAYVSEPTAVRVATSLQGAAEFTARIYGKSSHSGMAENGVNAIVPMADFVLELNKLDQKLRKMGPELGFSVNPCLNIGLIQGGVDVLLVPDYCEVSLDRQVFPGQDMQCCIDEIQSIFDGVCHRYNINGELTCNQYFDAWQVDKNLPVVQDAMRCHELVTGKQPEDDIFRAYAEIEMLDRQGIKGMLYGPGNIHQAHRPDEFVSIEEFLIATKTYALIAYDFVH